MNRGRGLNSRRLHQLTILNVNDSSQVTFYAVELTGQPTLVTFDNVALPPGTFAYASDKKRMTVLITSSMTAKPGQRVDGHRSANCSCASQA